MSTDTTTDHYDAIVMGAGFGGLRVSIELGRLGLNYRTLEAGSGVGGVWFWNRYPGARTDSESWVYCYQFDKDLLDEYQWTDRFPNQPQVEAYLNHVADRFDLRKNIDFEAEVSSAEYDEDEGLWRITTADGRTYTCKYFIPAGGPLTASWRPSFPGLDDYQGQWLHTSRWPKEGIDVRGKRVAVIGTGATGVQVIPEVARECEHLTVLQRTPNYVIPARNHPLTADEQRAIKMDYDKIWARCREQFFAMPIPPANRMTSDLTPQEQQRILERGWETGGFRFIFETFDDTIAVPEANKIVADFVREKIRAIVHVPETAEKLAPKDHPIAGKRPPLGHYYYEAYNRENVDLVSVKENPIERISEKGIVLADGTEFEVDVIIFATGFDALTGALTKIDLRGRDGLTIKDAWADGAQTHIGVATKGFPNLFMLFGPQTPFANFPPVAEDISSWIGQAIKHLEESPDFDTMEATQEAMDAWNQHVTDLVNATVIAQGTDVHSWMLGANIPGKTHRVLFHFGGVASFYDSCQKVIDDGWSGFEFRQVAPVTAGAV
ncbi:MAG: NAD(P)/FAD-dependent oxidoreductase [Solirubrobacterales bacterium]|nr:NAD(P)/FAD-dependent oxidoreductase [Solirubrobacterales bacterium]